MTSNSGEAPVPEVPLLEGEKLLDETLALQTTPAHNSEAHPERAPGARRSSLPRFPDYEIEGILGEGGMGIVYRARHLRLDRPVAIKAMLGGVFTRREAIDRMLNEIEAIARLRHPNIIQILDSGQLEGLPYYVMEMVDGGHLGEHLASHPPTIRQAAEYTMRLARAVDYAHQQGIVHRDLKPSNVLLTSEGDIKITDFGIAKRSDLEQSMTMTGTVLGTPGYLSPEQAEGRASSITPASDIFSLGVMLYEMITGRRPFDGASEMETLTKIMKDDPPSPAWFRPGLPRDLETICLKCLQKKPQRRYQTAGELADDLDRFLSDRVILARRTGRIERAIKWCRRHPAWATMFAALAIVIPGVIVGLTIANRQLASELARSQRLVDNNSQLARWIINEHLTQLDELPGAAQPQFELALKLQQFLEVTRAEGLAEGALQYDLAKAYEKVADVLGGAGGRHLGRLSDAANAYRVAISLLAIVRVASPSEDVERDYARCLVKLAGVVWQIDGLDAAVRLLDEAEPLIQAGYARNPQQWTGYFLALSQHRFDLANALNDLERAAAILQEINETIEQQSELNFESLKLSRDSLAIWTASNRGILAARQDDHEGARHWHQQELELARQMLAADPRSDRLLDQLVTSLVHLSDTLFLLGETEQAEQLANEAQTIAAQLYEADPSNVYLLSHWALVWERIQRIHFQQANFEKAIDAATRCVALYERIHIIDPKNIDNQRSWRVGLSALGDCYSQIERPEEAIKYYERALQVAKPLTEAAQVEPADWEGLAEAYMGLGAHYLKQWVALLEFEETIDFLKAVERQRADEFFKLSISAYDQIQNRAALTSSQQAMRGTVVRYQQMMAEIAKSIEETMKGDIF